MDTAFQIVTLLFLATTAVDALCPEAKCSKGHGPAVRFPFKLKGHQADDCGHPGFDLSCRPEFDRPVLELPSSGKLLVSNIDYKSQALHVYNSDGCHTSYLQQFNIAGTPFEFDYYLENVSLFNCSDKDKELRDSFSYYEVRCLRGVGYRIYAFTSNGGGEFSGMLSCQKMYNVSLVPSNVVSDPKLKVRLTWSRPDCRSCEAIGKRCTLKSNSSTLGTECVIIPKRSKGLQTGLVTAVAGILLLLGIIALVIFYKSRKTKKENEMKIQKFLKDYKALKPTRYSYTDIKRLTNQFKDELGQGAYGTVYKGKLSNEVFVAVKVLNGLSTIDREDFINEMKTMGRIHHINVARLVGFCTDGFRRALVYEFFPDGSLQKFISSMDKQNFLTWDKIQEIALGIARGIEYLHQGFDQSILHFNIKPHNILLDSNFTPKISDYGIAKLCSKDESSVTVTTTRGTMGYIAPEILSRNFGNVSYKSDIYSFGMLLLEIVGGKMFVDGTWNDNDQVYFAERICNLVEQHKDFQTFTGNQDDAKIVKKLAIVGLWCIQWNPRDRPSIKVIVQMLEGNEDLSIPPSPFASASPLKTKVRFAAENAFLELEIISQ